MRLHIPSFLHYLQCHVPLDIAILHHHYIVYLFSQTPVRLDFLQEMIAETVIRSCCEPIGTLTSTEEQSVLKTPIATHLETLSETLLREKTYLAFYRQKPGEGGGEVRYEYRVNLRKIQALIQAVRLQEDIKLIRQLIQGDYYTSLRLLAHKVYFNTGRVFSRKRLETAVLSLEAQGILTRDDQVRTEGRRVVCQN
jgi:hypothetical protein